MRMLAFLIFCLVGIDCATAEPAATETRPAYPYRTDGGDEKLKWYKLKRGEFPPPQSAHYIPGRLVKVDGPSRAGVFFPDSVSLIDNRGKFNAFSMLPFGSVRFHGAHAEIRDIPPGTHLHFQLFLDDDGKFTKALSVEDDFSFLARKGQSYRIEEVKVDAGLVRTFQSRIYVNFQGPDAKPAPNAAKRYEFAVNAATRVWKGRGYGTLSDLAPGQSVQLSFTGSVFPQPPVVGVCTDIWADEESQKLAIAQQLESYRVWIQPRGLPAIVTSTDEQHVTATLFSSADLFSGSEDVLAKQFKEGKTLRVITAEDNLRTYIYDGAINVKLKQVSNGPKLEGSSGIQFVFQPEWMLEGFRPGRVIRVFPEGWQPRSHEHPPEEAFHPIFSP